MGDRVEMRQYVAGDSPRMILWNVYARTRKLMVRVNERAFMLRPGACAYLIAGPGDEAAASVARTVIERKLLGESWAFGADGSPDPATDASAVREILARSSQATDEVREEASLAYSQTLSSSSSRGTTRSR